MNKVIKQENRVAVRLDGVYLNTEKHLAVPYVNDKNQQRFFGSLKFKNPEEAKKTVIEAMQHFTGCEDNIFYGAYPKWIQDDYGIGLSVNGHPHFYTDFSFTEEIEPTKVTEYIFTAEVHFTKTQDNTLYIRAVRLIVTGENESAPNDDLFEDEMLPY